VNKIKIKQKNSSFIQKFWWIFPLLILVSSTGYAYLLLSNKDNSESFNAQTAPITECLETVYENSTDCWYARYKTMVTQNPDTKEVFKDVKIAYEASSFVKSNCHQIAHIIGRAAGKKYQSVSEAYQQGDPFCWSGYYHGVMESITAKTGIDTVLNQINNICAELKNAEEFSFQHYNCVHGLGHSVLQLKNSELFEALTVCDSLDGVWQQESCQGGVFMENVMNKINPGHSTQYLKDDEPLYPCTAVEERYKHQCYLMQTSHALNVVNQDYSRVFALCEAVDSPYDTVCYQSLGRDASGSTSSNVEKTIELCNLGTTTAARENCFTGAVRDFISYFSNDVEALKLCQSISEPLISTTCNSIAAEYYRSF
jgi:hypothetical protein